MEGGAGWPLRARNTRPIHELAQSVSRAALELASSGRRHNNGWVRESLSLSAHANAMDGPGQLQAVCNIRVFSTMDTI